uniref:EF-hand calcium binding domain 3 n=1 Tax=Anas platyrhynchos TaxID=8839 RepID=A0A8B9TFX1_ANAPL
GRASKIRVKLKLLPKSLMVTVHCFQKDVGQAAPFPHTPFKPLSSPCLPAAFSDAFNFFPKDTDGNINRNSLEVTAQQLGISLAGQEAYSKLECAEADGECLMESQRGLVPEKSDPGSFDSVDARGILLCKVLLKMVELEALEGSSPFYWDICGLSNLICGYQGPRLYFLTSSVTWPWLYCDPCSIFPLPESAPRSSSPYAQVPVFPLILNEDTKALLKRKKNMQKLVMQRKKEPVDSTESHSIRKRNLVQEVRDKHDPRRQGCGVGTAIQPVARQYQRDLALRQRASLLRLWQRIGGAEIGRQAGSKRFHHTFSTYSWSWNACQELVTADELQALDRLNRRHPETSVFIVFERFYCTTRGRRRRRSPEAALR